MSEHSALGERAGIVIVFYRPDRDCVIRANRLARAWPCVVVDNTECVATSEQLGLDPQITYLANGANLGIATALNQGINCLKEAGCTCALLFDQDSEPSSQLLAELPAVLSVERVRNDRVALIGPAYEDLRLGGVAPFVRFGYLKLKRVQPTGQQPVEVDFLITSGSCLNLATWAAIGPMDESLFIDFVDLEWCVRARSKGYVVLGVPALRLSHELGDQTRICALKLEVNGTRQDADTARDIWSFYETSLGSFANVTAGHLAWIHWPCRSTLARRTRRFFWTAIYF